jgi:hypothetical protein
LVIPGAVAFAVAFQLITDVVPGAKAPSAAPETCRSPAHEALNDPFADVVVVSVALHLKFEQVLGEGMMFADDQWPDRALTPVAEGPVELFRSYPTQPAAEAMATDATTIKESFFICVISRRLSDGVRPASSQVVESEDYTTVEMAKLLS